MNGIQESLVFRVLRLGVCGRRIANAICARVLRRSLCLRQVGLALRLLLRLHSGDHRLGKRCRIHRLLKLCHGRLSFSTGQGAVLDLLDSGTLCNGSVSLDLCHHIRVRLAEIIFGFDFHVFYLPMGFIFRLFRRVVIFRPSGGRFCLCPVSDKFGSLVKRQVGADAVDEQDAIAVFYHSVFLCIILFLPVTYTMKAIPGMMFLLGIYCAGGYGGSVSAILINTPGTPHAAATMLDGHPLSKMGRTKAALKIALYASTFGGIFSALVLLFLGPQVAKISAQLGTAEYFMVCLFGMTIIAGVSGKSLVKGIIAACLGLLISCVGADPMTSYDRFTFGVHRLYLGLDLAVTLIGLFALVEIIGKAELKRSELNLHAGKIGNDDGKITKDEYKRMLRPVLIGSLIGSCVGIVPGTGASEASWFSYNTAKNLSKHPEEFGHGSVEGVAAAESANNAVCGATLIPLLTLGIPGDGCVAIMLSALMINGLNPGLSLFTTDGPIMYAIMLGLILVNIFMFLQGKYLTSLFAKVVSIPQQILTPIIVIFCFAGAYSVNNSYFDLSVALVFGVMAWFMRKLELPAVPVLLGMVLGNMTETNFRRALLISDGSPRIFVSSVYCWIFIALIVVVILGILRGKMKEAKNTKAEQ